MDIIREDPPSRTSARRGRRGKYAPLLEEAKRNPGQAYRIYEVPAEKAALAHQKVGYLNSGRAAGIVPSEWKFESMTLHDEGVARVWATYVGEENG